jgi:hypothetical protein
MVLFRGVRVRVMGLFRGLELGLQGFSGGLELGLWCLTPLSFNNISAISWFSILLVEETGVYSLMNCAGFFF